MTSVYIGVGSGEKPAAGGQSSYFGVGGQSVGGGGEAPKMSGIPMKGGGANTNTRLAAGGNGASTMTDVDAASDTSTQATIDGMDANTMTAVGGAPANRSTTMTAANSSTQKGSANSSTQIHSTNVVIVFIDGAFTKKDEEKKEEDPKDHSVIHKNR